MRLKLLFSNFLAPGKQLFSLKAAAKKLKSWSFLAFLLKDRSFFDVPQTNLMNYFSPFLTIKNKKL